MRTPNCADALVAQRGRGPRQQQVEEDPVSRRLLLCALCSCAASTVWANPADTPLLRAARLGPRARPARPLRRSRAFLLDRDVMDDPQPEGLGRATRVRRVPAVRALRGQKWVTPSALFVARRGCLQRLVDHRPKWRGYTERQSTTRTPIPRHGTLGAQITQPCGTDSLPRARRRRFLRAGGGGPRQQASLAVHALEVPSGARCRHARTRARGLNQAAVGNLGPK